MQFSGADVAGAIADFAREYGITHIVVGRSQRPWYARWLGPGLLDQLIRAVPQATVIVPGQA